MLLSLLVQHIEGGCLGAGSGTGSCPAAPFRLDMIMTVMINTTFKHNQRTAEEELDHIGGCPGWAECCTEYGYCHPKVFWAMMITKIDDDNG